MTKRIAIFLAIFLCQVATINAQTYLDHLQEKKSGTGTVNVSQSDAIDILVNGTANKSSKQDTKPAKQDQKTAKQEPKTTKQDVKPTPEKTTSQQSDKKEKKSEAKPRQQEPDSTKKAEPTKRTEPAEPAKKDEPVKVDNEKKEEHKEKEPEPPKPTTTTTPRTETTVAPVAVDNTRKVMRKSYRIKGYRVQVYSGAKRDGRTKAQRAGNVVKTILPGTPVYVHFSSPQWKCRVGNYRTIQEANAALRKLKKKFPQAIIVKMPITVQY